MNNKQEINSYCFARYDWLQNEQKVLKSTKQFS